MHDIETLITHFLGVSWGPVIPPGEALGAIEATKGNNGYYLVSDGGTTSYRTRIRTPSFPAHAMLAAAVPGPDDSRTCSPYWARWTLCWPTLIDEERKPMLMQEERHGDRGRIGCTIPPNRPYASMP